MEDRGKAIICEEIVLKIAWSTFVLSKTRSSIVTPEKLNLLCLEQNLIFLNVKKLIMFQILPDVRN